MANIIFMRVSAMRARFGSTVLLLITLLGVSPARAERQPQDPFVLWGIQKDCQLDFELSQAVQGSIDALGSPIHPVELTPGRARSCLGAECVDLLAQGCGQALPERGVLI